MRSTIGMTLKHNWRDILTKAWSMWLWGLAFLCIILDTAMPFLQSLISVPDPVFGVLSGVLAAAGLVARLMVQTNLPGEP